MRNWLLVLLICVSLFLNMIFVYVWYMDPLFDKGATYRTTNGYSLSKSMVLDMFMENPTVYVEKCRPIHITDSLTMRILKRRARL